MAKEIQPPEQGGPVAVNKMTPREISGMCLAEFQKDPALKRKYLDYVGAHQIQLAQLIHAART